MNDGDHDPRAYPLNIKLVSWKVTWGATGVIPRYSTRFHVTPCLWSYQRQYAMFLLGQSCVAPLIWTATKSEVRDKTGEHLIRPEMQQVLIHAWTIPSSWMLKTIAITNSKPTPTLLWIALSASSFVRFLLSQKASIHATDDRGWPGTKLCLKKADFGGPGRVITQFSYHGMCQDLWFLIVIFGGINWNKQQFTSISQLL